jgi:hypothetical protein
MLTFLFLVSLTATTVLLLAIAGEEVARITRAWFSQGNDEAHLNVATAPAAAGTESGELRHFPQRARVAARVSQPAELDAPDRAA